MRPRSSAPRSSFRRLGLGEQLESRDMLSGHGLAAFSPALAHFAASQVSYSSTTVQAATQSLASIFSHANVSGHTVLSTTLTDSAGTATGTANYSTYTANGTTETEFKVSVTGAAANTTLDVAIDGTVVGQITTDTTGAGKLSLSSNPDSSDEQALPANFPTSVTSGAAVTVGTLSGSLAIPTTGGGCGGEGNGSGQGHGLSDVTRLTSSLTDSAGSATGTVKYITGTAADGTAFTKFKVSVAGASASTTLDVAIDGTVVGQITTDTSGNGSLTLSSNPKNSNQQSLPSNFPTTIAAGSTITVGTLTGTLATPTETAASHGFRGLFGRHR